MDNLDLIIDLHIDGARQGPGSDEATRQAIALSGLKGKSGLKIADIGCGTGASALVLASELDAHITGIDFLQPFLDRLTARAQKHALSERITPSLQSMDALDLAEASLDAIWSEGAIYNIGFETGVRNWRPLLKPGGVLAVSEITWLTDTRPNEVEDHWTSAYPQIATASAKIETLEKCGYTPIGYFPLAPHCWLENYYLPMQQRFSGFLAQHKDAPAAQEIIAAEQHEIDIYKRFSEFFSYGFYLARKAAR